MTKTLRAVIFSLSLFITGAATAQTADEVIGKYVEAMGGLDKLKAIQSLYMEGVSVMQNGNEITSKTWQVQNKLYRREIEFGAGSVVIIITDKEGWSSNPRSGGSFEALPADVVKNQQFQLDCQGPLVDYAAKGHKASLEGKETIDNNECYKIKLTLNNGQDLTYFIDSKTYYIDRLSFAGGMFGAGRGGRPGGANGGGGANGNGANAETKINFSNYKKTTDGYVFPYTVTLGMGASLNYETIEVNKPVDEKLYKPAK